MGGRWQYQFWDYQGGAWQNNLGIRMTTALLSATMDRI